jgi:hypothetical protein
VLAFSALQTQRRHFSLFSFIFYSNPHDSFRFPFHSLKQGRAGQQVVAVTGKVAASGLSVIAEVDDIPVLSSITRNPSQKEKPNGRTWRSGKAGGLCGTLLIPLRSGFISYRIPRDSHLAQSTYEASFDRHPCLGCISSPYRLLEGTNTI